MLTVNEVLAISCGINLALLSWHVSLAFSKAAGSATEPVYDLTREAKLAKAERLFTELVESVEDIKDPTSRDIRSSLFALNLSLRHRWLEKASGMYKKMDT